MIKTWKIFLIIVIISGLYAPITHAQSSWTEKASTPKQGGLGEAVIGTGTHIYTIRAYSSGACNFWKYTPASNTWSSIIEWTPDEYNDPIPRPKSGTSMTWDGGDYIYIMFGAAYSNTGRRFFYRFDIGDETWEELADTPTDQGAGDALTWSGYDGKCYALMGSNSHGESFARYNPGDNSWETRSLSWSSIDDGASLAWTGDNHIYALRGEYEETVPHTDAAVYDIDANTWSSITDIPASNGVGDGGSMLWIGNWDSSQSDYIYALSGNEVDETPGSAFYVYSISGDEWSELDPLLYPVGYWVGNRLGYADSSIFCWQGAPSTWDGEGDKFSKYQLTCELTLIVRGGDNGVYYNAWDETGTEWSGWAQLPGSTPGRPAAATIGTDLHLVVRGSDGGIYHGVVDLETEDFSGWTKFPGGTPSAPSLAATETGLILTVRGNDNRIYYATYDDSWSSWTQLPGSTPDAVGTTVTGDTYHIMVRDSDSKMYHGQMTVSTETWQGWSLMTGTTPSQPVLSDDEEKVYLVVHGSDNGIYSSTYDGSWNSWTKQPGATLQSPGAAVYEGELWVCVTGITTGFYYSSTDLETSAWSGWGYLGGSSPSPPTLIGE